MNLAKPSHALFGKLFDTPQGSRRFRIRVGEDDTGPRAILEHASVRLAVHVDIGVTRSSSSTKSSRAAMIGAGLTD
jgi:hypothetical protein